MSEREKILGRIREALKLSAPVPGQHQQRGHDDAEPAHLSNADEFQSWLPVVGAGEEDRIAQFAENSEALKTEFILVNDEQELAEKLQMAARQEGWSKVGMHGDPLVEAAVRGLSCESVSTDGGYAVDDLESCDAGISACDFLVAQTGSIVVSSRSAGGRALSVLPPHHVVVARSSQLLADLPSAFEAIEEKYASGYPSFLSFITGPSRTGDIERILVLGAHGPKKLTVFLVAKRIML